MGMDPDLPPEFVPLIKLVLPGLSEARTSPGRDGRSHPARSGKQGRRARLWQNFSGVNGGRLSPPAEGGAPRLVSLSTIDLTVFDRPGRSVEQGREYLETVRIE